MPSALLRRVAKESLEQVVAVEQYFIDNLKPNLNVDLVASSSGYHTPTLNKPSTSGVELLPCGASEVFLKRFFPILI